MNKTQKTLLITAAIAGLVGGAVASVKTNSGNVQGHNLAGKPAPVADTIRMSCNGCQTKTNKSSAN